MKRHRTPWWMTAVCWALSGVMVVATGIAPASAEEPSAPPTTQTRPTLVAAAHALVAVTEASALQTTQAPPSGGAEEPRSFLGSNRGRIALVLLAAGVGWTIYSNSHDRITSPIR